jgi:hypothetical protein
LSLLPVRGVIAALLLEDLLPVLEVVASAPNRTTGFAAPTEAVPGPLSAIIFSQGLGLVAIGASLQDSPGSYFFDSTELVEVVALQNNVASITPPRANRLSSDFWILVRN